MYCGRTARVQARVNHIIEESTGEMVDIKSDCIILEGVVCAWDYHRFCTRAIYSYWREIWLEKVDRSETRRGRRSVRQPLVPHMSEPRSTSGCRPTGARTSSPRRSSRVLAQTYTNWRLVVSENGPGGGEVEAAVRPYTSDPRISFTATGENLGAAANWTRSSRPAARRTSR